MAREPISLDELLTRQDQANTLAVVEAVPDRSDRVRITPFVAGPGCSCALGVTVPKDVLESVTTTGEAKDRCGKRLMVVEVTFADPILSDVFRQLCDTARKAARARPERRRRRGRRESEARGGTCEFEHRHCVQACRRAYPHGGALYRACLRVCQEEYNACEGGGPPPDLFEDE